MLEMPHRVSPRLTVYSVGAVVLIMSAGGAGAAEVVASPPAVVLDWIAASVAVSCCSGGAAPLSTGATVGSSMGWECPNMAQPPSASAAARVTDRPGLKTQLKVILPSS